MKVCVNHPQAAGYKNAIKYSKTFSSVCTTLCKKETTISHYFVHKTKSKKAMVCYKRTFKNTFELDFSSKNNVVHNPSQSSPILTILVPFWFTITSLMFF